MNYVCDKTARADTLARRLASPVENVTENFYNDYVETRAKWALNNRDGVQTEEIYAVNMKNGVEVGRITDQNYSSAIKRTSLFNSKLKNADKSGDEILLIHNHPLGLPPSISDINALIENKNISGITVGHNGSIYKYTRPNKKISEDDWNIAMKHFKKYSDVTAMEKSLEVLGKNTDFQLKNYNLRRQL